eukprot:s3511_g1.t1
MLSAPAQYGHSTQSSSDWIASLEGMQLAWLLDVEHALIAPGVTQHSPIRVFFRGFVGASGGTGSANLGVDYFISLKYMSSTLTSPSPSKTN